MKFQIIGDDIQSLILNMTTGEKVMAEAGSMMYKKGGLVMDANLQGGIMGGLKRALTRESIFLVTYEATGDNAELGLTTPFPGHMKHVRLENSTIITQKDSFVCSYGNVVTDIEFAKRFGFGIFGGEGFILQKLTGTGDVFIHAGGNFIERELEAGELLEVDTGCIVAMDNSINYDIKSIGNIKTSLFAGEGLFVAALTGPGKVLLQTLPFNRMAEKIVSAVGTTQGESKGAAGIGSEIFKRVISG